MDHLTPQCVLSRPKILFSFFVKRRRQIQALSDEIYVQIEAKKRRTGRVGSGRVKVKTTCSDPELPGPLYDSSLVYVYND